MGWRLAVAGTVTLDDVTTPAGSRRRQQGGSAVYFALAAAALAPVHVIGVVGADGERSARQALDVPGVDLDGLEVAAGPTFRWTATHDFVRWVTSEEASAPGVSAAWVPAPPPAARAAEVLFLGSMDPSQQLGVLAGSEARLVGSDSMTVHIGVDADRVRAVLEGSDVLFLNRAELSALTGAAEADWVDAARNLIGRGRLRLAVVKAGPLGVGVVSAGRVVSRDAHPVDPVVDPTGAGDALAGGFLGACARAGRDPLSMLDEALDAGLRRAAAAIGTFGTDGLRRSQAAAEALY